MEKKFTTLVSTHENTFFGYFTAVSFLDDPPPYIDGVKINSPHYLCKIILGPDSTRNYTIVVSQYEKSSTIYYTLRAYATCPFNLSEIKDSYIQEKEVNIDHTWFLTGTLVTQKRYFLDNWRVERNYSRRLPQSSLHIQLQP